MAERSIARGCKPRALTGYAGSNPALPIRTIKMKKKTKRTKFIILVLLVILLGIFFNRSSVLLFLFGNNFSSTRDFTLTNEAVIKEDFKICDKVSEHGFAPENEALAPTRLHCYLDVIRKVGDKEICKKEEVISYIKIGSNQCYLALAESYVDKSFCSLMDSDSDVCVDHVNEEMRDNLCKYLKDQNNIKGCIVNGVYWYKPEYCDTFPNNSEDKDKCLLYAERNYRNPNLCYGINNIVVRNDCFFSAASQTRNPDFCNEWHTIRIGGAESGNIDSCKEKALTTDR